MKKLAREIASKISGSRCLLVVPGHDRRFVDYIGDEIDSSEVIEDERFQGTLQEDKVYISRFPVPTSLKKARKLIVISNFATPNLLKSFDQVIVKKSETLMKEGYLSPFKVRSFACNTPVFRLSSARVDFIASFDEALVLPANEEEGRVLRNRGIEVIDVFKVPQSPEKGAVILARKLKSQPAYLQMRSLALRGGVIIDLANNVEMEEWTKVTLGELGYFTLLKEGTTGVTSYDKSPKAPILKVEKDVKPRDLPEFTFGRGMIAVGGKRIGLYKIRGKRFHLTVNCGEQSTLSSSYPSIYQFISPMSTGKCSLFFSCVKVLGDVNFCKEVSFEAYVNSRNYVNDVSRVNFTSVARKYLKGVRLDKLREGVTLEIKVAEEIIRLSLRTEGNKFLVMCRDCGNFKETAVRIRGVPENYRKLERVIRDILLKEMITVKSRN
ncbi:hypothetical protein GWK48_08705 [Metallosphaera tengchongensis]|uniref:Uncharacterized protein n=1 Tax=Metallosphaera tengchongensis TaxID=1532350 RepID=A0A6N0NZ77_9CREN|nr:hypothetical protein [Metallosphaera tengchongensis]QKR00441.1 hypothetical protein GWK48_08705 [Metallosphaera tengchongensis]